MTHHIVIAEFGRNADHKLLVCLQPESRQFLNEEHTVLLTKDEDFEMETREYFCEELAGKILGMIASNPIIFVIIPKVLMEIFRTHLKHSERRMRMSSTPPPRFNTHIEMFAGPFDPVHLYAVYDKPVKPPYEWTHFLEPYDMMEKNGEMRVLLSMPAFDPAASYAALVAGDFSQLNTFSESELADLIGRSLNEKNLELMEKIGEMLKKS